MAEFWRHWELEVPVLPPLNSASDMTWKQKGRHKKVWRSAFRTLGLGSFPKPIFQHARVTITRVSMGQAPDWDNLANAAKYVLDSLEDVVILKDKPECIGASRVLWVPAKSMGEQFTHVEVVECDPRDLDMTSWPEGLRRGASD